MRKTKIVCTIGPVSKDEKIIEELIKCGMNVARLNFSHGTHEYHSENIETIKAVRTKLGEPIAILLDTKGPEVRVCSFSKGPINLEDGDKFTLTTRDVDGDQSIVKVTYPDFAKQLVKGNIVLIDDGSLELVVDDTTDTDLICTVIRGGKVSDNKGINVPNIHLDMPHLSERDKDDILFGIKHNVDYLAASFIRSKDDVIAIRKFLDYHGGQDIKIISKIENKGNG